VAEHHVERLRTIAAEMPSPPAAMEVYLAKVRERAYTVTDEDVEALKAAGITEDQIFEQTAAVAMREGLRRRDLALGLLG
jgi:alkylhydroperoxidase family enzyme